MDPSQMRIYRLGCVFLYLLCQLLLIRIVNQALLWRTDGLRLLKDGLTSHAQLWAVILNWGLMLRGQALLVGAELLGYYLHLRRQVRRRFILLLTLLLYPEDALIALPDVLARYFRQILLVLRLPLMLLCLRLRWIGVLHGLAEHLRILLLKNQCVLLIEVLLRGRHLQLARQIDLRDRVLIARVAVQIVGQVVAGAPVA